MTPPDKVTKEPVCFLCSDPGLKRNDEGMVSFPGHPFNLIFSTWNVRPASHGGAVGGTIAQLMELRNCGFGVKNGRGRKGERVLTAS